MHRSWRLVVVALCLVFGAARVSTGDAPKKTQYLIDVLLFEGDPLGSREAGTLKIVAEPRQVTTEKRESSFHSGGIVKLDGDEVPFGVDVKLTPERGEEGTIRLKIVLEYTELLSHSEDSVQLQSDRARFVRTVKPGEVLRLPFGKPADHRRWVELTVREYEPGK